MCSPAIQDVLIDSLYLISQAENKKAAGVEGVPDIPFHAQVESYKEKTGQFKLRWEGETQLGDFSMVDGSSRENTAGLYSPYLKQLLIWNVPQRDMMFRTIVHEGFHQYLDMVAPGTPRWFNEGMAENMELYETVNGKFTEGQSNMDHLELLMEARMPLEHFLRMPTSAFYRGNVGVHYAQGWAFVHFLRNSGRDEQKIFDALFHGFENSPSTSQVMEAAFEGVDMKDLEARFVKHIKDLYSK